MSVLLAFSYRAYSSVTIESGKWECMTTNCGANLDKTKSNTSEFSKATFIQWEEGSKREVRVSRTKQQTLVLDRVGDGLALSPELNVPISQRFSSILFGWCLVFHSLVWMYILGQRLLEGSTNSNKYGDYFLDFPQSIFWLLNEWKNEIWICVFKLIKWPVLISIC